MSHDQNFKNLILDYPLQALAFFAAEEAAGQLTGAEVLPVRQEQLKERLGERFRELDIPLLVTWPDGRREAVLFVLEEESDPRRFSIHRLAHYCLDLAELLATDRVVPVVIFLRGRAPRRKLTLGGERHTYLSFRFLACELATLAYERFRDSKNIVARLNLPNMRCAPAQRVDAYAHAVRGLAQLEDSPEKQLKYIDFIDIYANLDNNERVRYAQEYPEEAAVMSNFAERFIQQGKQEGEAAVLLRLIALKFGPPSESVSKRVRDADAETLLKWSERVLSAENLDQVFH